jgi:hypothetical protein
MKLIYYEWYFHSASFVYCFLSISSFSLQNGIEVVAIQLKYNFFICYLLLVSSISLVINNQKIPLVRGRMVVGFRMS